LTFVNITNNVIITSTQHITFNVHGNVNIVTTPSKPDPVISINGSNSYIEMHTTQGQSCITDVDKCTSGFTFSIDINFHVLVDNTFIISSGGNLDNHKGIALYYSNNQLHYIVTTSTFTWTLVVNYKPTLNVWQHFDLTWNFNLGVEILVNGHVLGNNGRPNPSHGSQTKPLCVACSHGTVNVNVGMLVTGIISWSLDRNELVNAGKQPGMTSVNYVMKQ